MSSVARSADLVHASLRDAILTGELAENVVLSQVQLAKELGVSRTPLREALRMLQAEGLIDSEPNQRVRVTGVSVNDLEQLYTMRITLEAIAVRLSTPRFTTEDLTALHAFLDEMDGHAEARDIVRWNIPHREYHRRLTAHAGERMHKLVNQLADNSDRYRRVYVTRGPDAWRHTAAEHRAILAACESRDAALAGTELARHLARTALTVIAMAAPEHDPVAVRLAVSLATQGEAHGNAVGNG
jgi:DNA-binding GntR family transcriptional regulator